MPQHAVTVRLRLLGPLTAVWWCSILLLGLALPFEIESPWLRVGSLFVLTNLEIVTLLALLLWFLRQLLLAQLPRWRTPLTAPIIALLVALALSSLAAPSENLNAAKVTARWCTGALVYFMLVNALDSGFAARRLLQACVLSGFVVAVLALLEASGASAVINFLSPFRDQRIFEVGGQLRVSSTLAYTTIAAMYLEFMLCFTLAWFADACSRRQFARAFALVCALLLVAEAMILTLTRGALLATVGALLLVAFARRRQWRVNPFTPAALAACVALAVLWLASSRVSPVLALRLSSESDRSWFQADYAVAPLPVLHANETVTVSVRLKNVGQQSWNAQGAQPVHLFYHWLSADRRTILVADGQRTELPRDIAPGEAVTVSARVQTPSRMGDYVLGWDMVREDVYWFSVIGWPVYEMPVSVLAGTQTVENVPPEKPGPNATADLHLERGVLWNAVLRMLVAHPVLGVGAGNFRLVLGQYLGLAAWDIRLHANNTYLEQFADAGVLGGLAFLLLVAAALWHAARALRCPQPLQDSLWLSGVAAALGALMIHGAADYFLEFTSIYLLFWLSLAILTTFVASNRSSV